VELESLPCEDLEEFFEGPEASGESDEGIGFFTHEGLARVHSVGDVKLGDALMCHLEFDQHFRDDTYDAAVGGECRLGDGVHETHVGSSVDDADVAFGETASERCGGFVVERVSSVCGGAEDSDVADHTDEDNRMGW
jgi:hypothetical protein